MAEHRHLRVVRTPEEEHGAKTAALQQIAGRVPSQMRRVHDWDSEAAHDLFEAMNHYVANQEMEVGEIENALDMEGLRDAYLDWLGRQS